MWATEYMLFIGYGNVYVICLTRVTFTVHELFLTGFLLENGAGYKLPDRAV